MARTKQTARKANTGGTNLQPAVKSPRRSSRTKPKSKSPRRGANRTGFTSSDESDDNMPGTSNQERQEAVVVEEQVESALHERTLRSQRSPRRR